MIDDLLTFIPYLIDGLYELGQKLFQTHRADELIGCFDQRGHFGNCVLVFLDVKGF